MADLFFETSVFFAQKNRYLSQSIGFLSRTRFGLNGANLAFDFIKAMRVCFMKRRSKTLTYLLTVFKVRREQHHDKL
jgi:hypothetical protein